MVLAVVHAGFRVCWNRFTALYVLRHEPSSAGRVHKSRGQRPLSVVESATEIVGRAFRCVGRVCHDYLVRIPGLGTFRTAAITAQPHRNDLVCAALITGRNARPAVPALNVPFTESHAGVADPRPCFPGGRRPDKIPTICKNFHL